VTYIRDQVDLQVEQISQNFAAYSEEENQQLEDMIENLIYERLLLDHHLASQTEEMVDFTELEEQELSQALKKSEKDS